MNFIEKEFQRILLINLHHSVIIQKQNMNNKKKKDLETNLKYSINYDHF